MSWIIHRLSFVNRLLLVAVVSSACLHASSGHAVLTSATSREPINGGDERPNIIVILSDDMGYSDIGCYGGEAETPVLDSLANNGIRFTQFYNTARCCPTRASLLTGLYPHQAGIGWMMNDNGYDGYRGELNQQCRTLGEVMRSAGYGTYAVGKWHVTKSVKPDGPKDNWPLQRGFDRFYGTIHGAGSFFDPNSLTRDNAQISPFADPEYQPETYYYTDAISDHAVRFIQEHQQQTSGKPFLMYVAYTAAHWPMHALPEDIARYKGRFDAGYDQLRAERLQRMLKLGVIDPTAQMSPADEDWGSVSNREWELRCMEVCAAMIDRMDQGIGRITSALNKADCFDNTLILFMQDNGGCAEGLGRNSRRQGEVRAQQATMPAMAADELQFDMIPKQTRDGFPVLQGPRVMPGAADTYIAYGRGWANVSNTPFREYKHWVHEGGISTPLVAHWPKGIRRSGVLEHQPGHLIDIMATCVDVAQADYPHEANGTAIKPLEGKSLRPAFDGQTIERDALYWEHEGNRAVRQGDWKLVAKGADGPWELYNIASDRSELQNLAAEMPYQVDRLSAMWQAWAERASVLPLTPYYKKATARTSDRKEFRLQQGDDLGRDEAPNIADKAFRISVDVRQPGTAGVIIAQGGTAAGYSLYVHHGQLCFAVRDDGRLSQVSCAAPVAPGKLLLDWGRQGRVVIRLGDHVLIDKKLAGRLDAMPLDGLQVGTDQSGLVGEYDSDFNFNGQLGHVELTIH